MNGKIPVEKVIPPYVSYKTFRGYLDILKKDGIPARLDGSVMKTLSGQTQSQLRGALRFFNLKDADYVPQETLDQLVHASNEERQVILRELVTTSYFFIFGPTAKIDVSKATPQQFSSVFKDTGLNGDTVRKGESFFLQIAEEAGIPVSRHIKAGRTSGEANRSARPRKSPNGQTKKDTSGTGSPNGNSGGVTPPSGGRVEPKRISLKAKLMHIMVDRLPEYDPQWSPEMQVKWMESWERMSEKILAMEDEEIDEEENIEDE
jgi:hypothetical protein